MTKNSLNRLAAAVTVAVICIASFAGCDNSTEAVRSQREASEASNPDFVGLETSPAAARTTSVGSPGEAAHSESIGMWLLLTFVIAAVAATSLALTVWMYRWRRHLPDGQLSILPETVMSTTERLSKVNLAHLQATRAAFQNIKSDYADIRESFKIFAEAAALKDAQIERLRQGNDKHVYRQFLGRFVRVLRVVEADIEEDRAAGKEVASLISVRNQLLDALADAGAELFEPPPGSDYRKRSDVADRPGVVPTDDPKNDWLIARTLKPGFVLRGGGEPIMVERAVVEILRHGA